jgi:FAD/FMN-containing dehydrogenase
MKQVVVDPDARTARHQPGVTVAELEQAGFYWGLAPLVDSYGLVAANLIAASVVLPDGELVDADAETLRDLRAGDPVGIVVDATYRLHPLPDLTR